MNKLATLSTAVLLTLAMLAPAAAQHHDDLPLGDLVEVVTLKDKVVAIDAHGGSQRAVRLKAKEEVIWTGAKGKIGVALTSLRMLVFSADTGAWQELSYAAGEAYADSALVGDRVALVVTGYRVVGFNGHFAEVRLQAKEKVVAGRVGENVGVCVTTQRALGFATSTGEFVEVQIGGREQIVSVTASANFATVTTEQRIRVFRAPSASWEVRRVRN